MHPSGRFVYVGNRGTPTAGRRNEIAVFRINEATGEPTLVQNADTRGFTPRTFALDPSGRLLVVGNQSSVSVRDGNSTTEVPANLAVFRIGSDGTLTFVQRHDVAVVRRHRVEIADEQRHRAHRRVCGEPGARACGEVTHV